MKHIIVCFLSCFVSAFFSSCSSKQTPINNLANFVEELQQNSEVYAEEDWKNAEQTYEEIEIDLERYHSEYSDEEIREIGRLKGQCAAIMTKNVIKEFKNDMKDAINETAGFVEGFAKGVNNKEE